MQQDYSILALNNLLQKDPLIYFNEAFMNKYKHLWTTEMFDYTNDRLVEKICLKLFELIKNNHIQKEFSPEWKYNKHVEIDMWVCDYLKRHQIHLININLAKVDTILMDFDFNLNYLSMD